MSKAASSPKIYSALAIALLSASTITPPSAAETNTAFFCGTSNGVPATIAKTPRGEVPMILWNSSDIGNASDTQQKLCQEVSTKLQTYHSSGKLKYITTGMMDGQRVACLAETEGGACSELLFPLKSADENSRATLQRVFRIRVASAGPIDESGTRLYISLDKFLNGEYPSFTPNTGRVPGSQTGNSPR